MAAICACRVGRGVDKDHASLYRAGLVAAIVVDPIAIITVFSRL
jgi:hypothetical protein